MNENKKFYMKLRENYKPDLKAPADVLPEWIENLKKYFDKTAVDDPRSIR